MAVAALVVLVAWLAIVAGLRGWLTYRRSGSVPLPPPVERGSAQWWARVAGSIGIALAFAAPLAELLGLPPIEALNPAPVRIGGLILAVVGILGTVGAQVAMGESWRPDVMPGETTALVTTGPFRLVRNPILACTALTSAGVALMVPNGIALLAVAAVLTSINVQVRLVEEPHLERVHGDAYRAYAARTSRFVPLIGRRR